MVAAVVAFVGVLSACSSSRPTTPPDTGRVSVVDGITIPAPATSSAVPPATAPAACPASLRTAFASAQRGRPVTTSTRRDPNLLLCGYRAAAASATACRAATVSINTEPQAFQAFNRWSVETGQNASWGHDPSLAPQPVSGVGLLAEWVPKTHTLGTASVNTWVMVSLTCAASMPQPPSLALDLGRAGLAATS